MIETLPAWDEIARYEKPLPRYTSYPTAPHWGSATAREGVQALSKAKRGEPLAVYVHLPFCSRLCSYCGCHSVVTRQASRMEAYVDHVLGELPLVAGHLDARSLQQLHLGGGTPTYLPVEQFDRLLKQILERFAPVDGAELAVEVDPCTVTREHFQLLKRRGFNRVSIGVQDLNEHVQDLVGRHQSPEATLSAYTMAREVGFAHINLDLMFGLPGQTVESIAQTAQGVAQLRPQRLSVFGYAHVPHLKPQQRSWSNTGCHRPNNVGRCYAPSKTLPSSQYTRERFEPRSKLPTKHFRIKNWIIDFIIPRMSHDPTQVLLALAKGP